MSTPNRSWSRPRLRVAIARGWRRRCPRCGEGPLFRRWLETHERCGACDLVYQKDHGNTLMFMIITDRVPLLLGVVVLYFGFRATSWLGHAGFLAMLAGPLLLTLRQRQGVALALDYMFGACLGDPAGSDVRDELSSSSRRGRTSQTPTLS